MHRSHRRQLVEIPGGGQGGTQGNTHESTDPNKKK